MLHILVLYRLLSRLDSYFHAHELSFFWFLFFLAGQGQVRVKLDATLSIVVVFEQMTVAQPLEAVHAPELVCTLLGFTITEPSQAGRC